MTTKVGFLHSLIRPEEKLLIKEFESRDGVEVVMLDDRKLAFNLGEDRFSLDVVLERRINHSRALHALRLFESAGGNFLNPSKFATICRDKNLTPSAPEEHQGLTPAARQTLTK